MEKIGKKFIILVQTFATWNPKLNVEIVGLRFARDVVKRFLSSFTGSSLLPAFLHLDSIISMCF